MQNYLLLNLSELAQRRAIILREEAQLFDILARDLKREAKRLEENPVRRLVRDPLPAESSVSESKEQKPYVRIPEAAKMMGMSRSSLYLEIGSGRIRVRKNGRKTLIAVADIHDWFKNLPEKE